jgi:hypothetical protein
LEKTELLLRKAGESKILKQKLLVLDYYMHEKTSPNFSIINFLYSTDIID